MLESPGQGLLGRVQAVQQAAEELVHLALVVAAGDRLEGRQLPGGTAVRTEGLGRWLDGE
jgi:hypothetical protein